MVRFRSPICSSVRRGRFVGGDKCRLVPYYFPDSRPSVFLLGRVLACNGCIRGSHCRGQKLLSGQNDRGVGVGTVNFPFW